MQPYRVHYTEDGWQPTPPDHPFRGEQQTIVHPADTCRLVVDLLREAPGMPPAVDLAMLEEPWVLDEGLPRWRSTIILRPEDVELVPG